MSFARCHKKVWAPGTSALTWAIAETQVVASSSVFQFIRENTPLPPGNVQSSPPFYIVLNLYRFRIFSMLIRPAAVFMDEHKCAHCPLLVPTLIQNLWFFSENKICLDYHACRKIQFTNYIYEDLEFGQINKRIFWNFLIFFGIYYYIWNNCYFQPCNFLNKFFIFWPLVWVFDEFCRRKLRSFLTDLLPFNYNLLPFFNEFFMRY